MKNKIYLLLFILFTSQTMAQVEHNSTLTELGLSITEKSILSTDREIYFTGEEIFFAAYNFIEENPANENLSKIIYLELLNNQQSILKEKFALQNGQASGVLYIPEELETGNYFIRAYTNYQRNKHPETFFTKVVRIVNPDLPLPPFQFLKDEHIKYAIEEGNLETNKLSAISYFIHPVLIENSTNICLVNEDDSCINILQPLENGLGKFSFAPSKDMDYFIQIELAHDQTIKQKLIKNNHLFLVRTYSSDEILRLNIGLQNIGDQGFSDSLKLIIKSSSFKNIGESKFKLNTGLASIKVDPSILEAGINYALIQDMESQILHIHPIFRKPQNLVQLPIKLNKGSFTTRELIRTKISLPTGQKNADISMTVVKRGSTYDLAHLPYFLIENPVLINSWLTNHQLNNEIIDEINLLMGLYEKDVNSSAFSCLSQNPNQSKIFWLPETRGISISGILRHRITKVAQQNSKLILSVFGKHPQSHFTNTKADGSFVFALKNLHGPQSISIKMDDFNTSNFELLINNDFAVLPALQNSAVWFSKAEKKHLNQMFFNRQTGYAFNHESARTNTISSNYKDLWIYDTTIYMKDYVASENMEQLIDEIIPFIHARETDGEYAIVVQDKEVLSTYTNPFVLLDNYPVKNINALLKLNPKIIQKVSIIYSPYNSGNKKLNGIVSFHTNTDNFGGFPVNQSTVFLNFITESSQLNNEFTSYKPDRLPKSIPDFGNLLYWNPSIKLNGETEIKFYSSDDNSTYDIFVQGLTGNGQPICGRTSFNIKNP